MYCNKRNNSFFMRSTRVKNEHYYYNKCVNVYIRRSHIHRLLLLPSVEWRCSAGDKRAATARPC